MEETSNGVETTVAPSVYLPSEEVKYVCTGCGAGRRKLWREAGRGPDAQRLQCSWCARTQDKAYTMKINSTTGDHFDQASGKYLNTIGKRVPAIPLPSGKGFYWEHEVPESARRWWQSLPL